MGDLGKFARSLVVKRRLVDKKKILAKLRGDEKEEKSKSAYVPVDKKYVRYHWEEEDGHHIIIYEKMAARVVYSVITRRPMKEIEYTNKAYGIRKMVHEEKKFRG